MQQSDAPRCCSYSSSCSSNSRMHPQGQTLAAGLVCCAGCSLWKSQMQKSEGCSAPAAAATKLGCPLKGRHWCVVLFAVLGVVSGILRCSRVREGSASVHAFHSPSCCWLGSPRAYTSLHHLFIFSLFFKKVCRSLAQTSTSSKDFCHA